MKYSYSALVLATFAVTQAVAGPLKHAHNHLHKKHDTVLEAKAEEKRDWNDVNFATVLITYSSGQTFGDPTKVAVAAAAAVTSSTKPAVVDAKKTSTTAAAVPTSTSTSAASSSKAAATSGIDSTGTQNTILSSAAKSRLAAMGAQVGTNSVSNNGGIWVGKDGPFTATFSNSAGQDLIVACWGPTASWINAKAPFITHSIASGASITLSFASGVSGACAPIHSDTQLVNGQVSNTWLEFTFGPTSVFDVSREVNMSGHSISAVGDICISDMSRCVFTCSGGVNVCTFGYVLENCAAGSQVGAEYGLDFGAPSGGCRLSGTHVDVTLS